MRKLLPRMQLNGYTSAVLQPLIKVLDGSADDLRQPALNAICAMAVVLGPGLDIFLPSIRKVGVRVSVFRKKEDNISTKSPENPTSEVSEGVFFAECRPEPSNVFVFSSRSCLETHRNLQEEVCISPKNSKTPQKETDCCNGDHTTAWGFATYMSLLVPAHARWALWCSDGPSGHSLMCRNIFISASRSGLEVMTPFA